MDEISDAEIEVMIRIVGGFRPDIADRALAWLDERPGKKTTFDRTCFDLAEQVLADEPRLNSDAHKQALATAIAAFIEDEITLMLIDQP